MWPVHLRAETLYNLINPLTHVGVCTFYEGFFFFLPNPKGQTEATQQNCHIVLSVKRVLQSNLTSAAIS